MSDKKTNKRETYEAGDVGGRECRHEEGRGEALEHGGRDVSGADKRRLDARLTLRAQLEPQAICQTDRRVLMGNMRTSDTQSNK